MESVPADQQVGKVMKMTSLNHRVSQKPHQFTLIKNNNKKNNKKKKHTHKQTEKKSPIPSVLSLSCDWSCVQEAESCSSWKMTKKKKNIKQSTLQ